MAAVWTRDCVREHGGKECSQTLNVPGTHLSWKYTHTSTHTHRVMIPSVSLLFKQLQPAVTACVGSFTEKQSFQTLAFPYHFHPGCVPGFALSRLYFFPCLASVSPFSLSYPLLCSAIGALEPAVSCLLVLWMEEQCVAMAKSMWMHRALQHWGVALWIQTRLCGAPIPASKENKYNKRVGKHFSNLLFPLFK